MRKSREKRAKVLAIFRGGIPTWKGGPDSTADDEGGDLPEERPDYGS
jgi:hypothetical protein